MKCVQRILKGFLILEENVIKVLFLDISGFFFKNVIKVFVSRYSSLLSLFNF